MFIFSLDEAVKQASCLEPLTIKQELEESGFRAGRRVIGTVLNYQYLAYRSCP